MANPFNLKSVKKQRTLIGEDEANDLLKIDARNTGPAPHNQQPKEKAETTFPREDSSSKAKSDELEEIKKTGKNKISSDKKELLAKTRDPEYIMATIYLPKELHTEIKRTLLENNGKDISDLVGEFIMDGLLKAGVKLKNEKELRKLMTSKHKKA
jgi:hypothetical protein